MNVHVQGEEVIDYLKFLYETDKLEEVFPQLEIPEELVVSFVQYMQNKQSIPSIKVTKTATKASAITYKPRHWSSTDIHRLKVLIANDCSIEQISENLKRSVSSVRSKAKSTFNAVYINNHWTKE
jgi:hypothetical protein